MNPPMKWKTECRDTLNEVSRCSVVVKDREYHLFIRRNRNFSWEWVIEFKHGIVDGGTATSWYKAREYIQAWLDRQLTL